jgi:hypothetical protein
VDLGVGGVIQGLRWFEWVLVVITSTNLIYPILK